ESKINDIFFNEPKTKEVIRSTQDDELSQVTGSYLDSFVEFHPMNDKKELEKEAQALFEELQAQVKAEENNNTQDQVIQPQIQKENEVVKQQSSIQYISETIRANEPKKPTPFQDIIDAYNEQRDPQGDSDDLIDLNELAKSSQAQSDENEIQVSEPPEEVTFILSENPKQMPDNTDDDTPEISEAIEIQHEENNIEPMQVQNNAIENLQENVVQEEPQEQNVQNNEETKQETQPEKQGFSIDAELEPPKVPGLSFSMFLSGFATDEIHDEFMICAFYIKNILRQHDFTMKYINSKLFQATGKIADTSIVDELIEKEYIKIIMTDDFTKYSIAPKGEEYLINKLQN
ncbi:MAG: hypothetical protein IJ877_07795, partial [Candidatus Gastranaerophilales bacterium]|nr:hypothetical protein [Candidatus Gastranaerophilales bacterium]